MPSPRPCPRCGPAKVVVYGTLEAARRDGARQSKGRLMLGDEVVVTPASIAPFLGLRVTEFRATTSAIAHRNWTRLEAVLQRSVTKFRS